MIFSTSHFVIDTSEIKFRKLFINLKISQSMKKNCNFEQ